MLERESDCDCDCDWEGEGGSEEGVARSFREVERGLRLALLLVGFDCGGSLSSFLGESELGIRIWRGLVGLGKRETKEEVADGKQQWHLLFFFSLR